MLPDEAVSYPFDSGEVLRLWRRGTRKVTDDLTLAAMALEEAQVALVDWHDVPRDDAAAMVAWVRAEWRQ